MYYYLYKEKKSLGKLIDEQIENNLLNIIGST